MDRASHLGILADVHTTVTGVDLVLREGASDSSTENETPFVHPLQNGGFDGTAHLLHDHLQLLIKERLSNQGDEWFVNCVFSGFLITKARLFGTEEHADSFTLRVATKQSKRSLYWRSLDSSKVHFRNHKLGLEDYWLYR